MSQTKSNLILN